MSQGRNSSGGAAETHFCCATLGWQGFFKALNPLSWILVFIFHIDAVVRTAALLVLELVLATYDCIRGALAGQYVLMEMQFIVTRVFICILLRELIVLGAKIDIARGLPVIHVNFFGYDEQSHRRGPSSFFAHWSLRGIDQAIARLWKAARLSERRDYDLWVYSDHGQEDTLPYPVEHKRWIEDIVAEIFGETIPKIIRRTDYRHPDCYVGRYSKQGTHRRVPSGHSQTVAAETETCRVTVTGMGPLAHIYPAVPLTVEEKERIGREILKKSEMSLLLIPLESGKVKALTPSADYLLPEEAPAVLGYHHPFLFEAAQDIVQMCHHPSSGALILSGWVSHERPRTFPVENGSHAGFGPEETNGFALLPQDTPLPERPHDYVRPLYLREAALRVMGRCEPWECTIRPPSPSRSLRLVCYNVHGCVGRDGRHSPERIARVLMRHNPDAIVLQELDMGRKRSGEVHQAEIIAQKLRMSFHFHPSFTAADGHYGNAILSRYPMRVIKVGRLPRLYNRREFEPRGALWVELDLDGTRVNLINTHLSIWPRERLLQTAALMGEEWVASPQCANPVILAGDFNAGPGSRVYQRITSRLFDAQTLLEFHRPHGTWFGPYAFTRIDHMFVTPEIKVSSIHVPRTELDRVASDHFPLFIDLEIASFSPMERADIGKAPLPQNEVPPLRNERKIEDEVALEGGLNGYVKY